MNQIPQLKKGDHIHLMGICGTAMASLAGLLKSQGYKITGSDQNVYPPMSTQLEELGIEIQQGYRKENLEPRPDLVIVGNVISKTFEEAQALLESDIAYTSLPKAIGEFVIQDRNSIVMTGTHGKTTTTAMMSVAGESAVPGLGYMVGGIPENFGRSFRNSKNDWFTIEGDEYDTAFFDKVPKFIYYKPKYVVLTSIEFDHADIYDSLDQILASFQRLLELIPEDGVLMYNAEDENIAGLLKHAKCKKVSYGKDRGDYRFVDREILFGRNQFAVLRNENKIADIAVKAPGEYNAMNALAVYALSQEMGWDSRKVLQGLADFKGVKRRQQFLGEPNGVKIIEDFAHHPTSVEKTIQAVKEQYEVKAPNKLIALFEPRSATSRRNIFQEAYAKAFVTADKVYIAEPFDQSKISENERFSSEGLVNDLKQQGCDASSFNDIDKIVDSLTQLTEKGDLILIMSNGAFGGIYDKLLNHPSWK